MAVKNKKGKIMKKRQICNPKNKIEQVMHEYKEGKLRAGKGKKLVTTRKQAVAIALSESKSICNCKR